VNWCASGRAWTQPVSRHERSVRENSSIAATELHSNSEQQVGPAQLAWNLVSEEVRLGLGRPPRLPEASSNFGPIVSAFKLSSRTRPSLQDVRQLNPIFPIGLQRHRGLVLSHPPVDADYSAAHIRRATLTWSSKCFQSLSCNTLNPWFRRLAPRNSILMVRTKTTKWHPRSRG
jgi:hypothetical protein